MLIIKALSKINISIHVPKYKEVLVFNNLQALKKKKDDNFVNITLF